MSAPARRIWTAGAITVGLAVAFVVGRWTGGWQRSLRAEATYPWDLHRKIGSLDIDCNRLLASSETGEFITDTIDNGTTFAVVHFNRSSGLVRASLVDSAGRYATDSWTMDCN